MHRQRKTHAKVAYLFMHALIGVAPILFWLGFAHGGSSRATSCRGQTQEVFLNIVPKNQIFSAGDATGGNSPVPNPTDYRRITETGEPCCLAGSGALKSIRPLLPWHELCHRDPLVVNLYVIEPNGRFPIKPNVRFPAS